MGMAESSPSEMLFLLLLLQVKHGVFDGPLQRQWMLREKGFYGKWGGIVHASLHGLGSSAALFLAGISFVPALGLAILDAAVHYHIDFIKELFVRRNGWTANQAYFWWVLTADQMMHQFTYLAMAAILFASA